MLTDYTNTPENRDGRRFSRPRPAARTDAEGENRTPTSCLTRPSNVRVYQFRHFRSEVVKRPPAARGPINFARPAAFCQPAGRAREDEL